MLGLVGSSDLDVQQSDNISQNGIGNNFLLKASLPFYVNGRISFVAWITFSGEGLQR